jgi:hypothetical protein
VQLLTDAASRESTWNCVFTIKGSFPGEQQGYCVLIFRVPLRTVYATPVWLRIHPPCSFPKWLKT